MAAAKFDPTIELNPTPILIAIALLAAIAVGIVAMIITTSERDSSNTAVTPE